MAFTPKQVNYGKQKPIDLMCTIDFVWTGEKTQDTGSPIFDVKTSNGSYMEGCKSESTLYIWAVSSEIKGDFKEMMNTVVKNTSTNKICFTMVINDNLANVLKGFKWTKHFHDGLKEDVDCLEGEWNEST